MSDLRNHADFMRLWKAQAISAFGSRITRTALPIIAVKTLGMSETVVATLGALQLAPGVVLALFAGGFVDRSRKRRILVGADVFRAVVVLSLTLAWALGALTMAHVIVVGALVGAASSLFQITDVAYLPALIPHEQLAEGNAKLSATEALAEVAGPASAGVLIAALGAPLAVLIDAASYLWSALMLSLIRTREPVPKRAEPPIRLASLGIAGENPGPPSVPSPAPGPSTSLGWQTTKDLRLGMRTVFTHPQVRPIAMSLIVWSVTSGFFVALYAMFCLRELDLSVATFGVIVAMGGIGALGGALVSRRLVRGIGLGWTLIMCAAASTSTALFIPLASGSRTTVLLFLGGHQLLSDGFAAAFMIQAVTLRQTVLPKEVLGRANAAIHVCTLGLLPITAILAGVLAEATTIRFAVWVGVVIGMLTPLTLLPLRRLKQMPLSPRA